MVKHSSKGIGKEDSNDKTIKKFFAGCDDLPKNAHTENTRDHSSDVVIEIHRALDSLLVPKSISFNDHILEFDKSLYSDDNASIVAMPEFDELLGNT